MIRSTVPVTINALTGEQAIVYLMVNNQRVHDLTEPGKQTVSYHISVFTMNEDGDRLSKIMQLTALFRLGTWMYLFGGMTASQINSQIDSIFMQQIDYVNTRTDWTGNEIQRPKYWDLTLNQMEVYTPPSNVQIIL
jgi:hypothetical protein